MGGGPSDGEAALAQENVVGGVDRSGLGWSDAPVVMLGGLEVAKLGCWRLEIQAAKLVTTRTLSSTSPSNSTCSKWALFIANDIALWYSLYSSCSPFATPQAPRNWACPPFPRAEKHAPSLRPLSAESLETTIPPPNLRDSDRFLPFTTIESNSRLTMNAAGPREGASAPSPSSFALAHRRPKHSFVGCSNITDYDILGKLGEGTFG
jgi:hypothetical protein